MRSYKKIKLMDINNNNPEPRTKSNKRNHGKRKQQNKNTRKKKSMQKQRSNLSLARLWEVAGEEDPLLPEKKALYYPREQNPESDF